MRPMHCFAYCSPILSPCQEISEIERIFPGSSLRKCRKAGAGELFRLPHAGLSSFQNRSTSGGCRKATHQPIISSSIRSRANSSFSGVS